LNQLIQKFNPQAKSNKKNWRHTRKNPKLKQWNRKRPRNESSEQEDTRPVKKQKLREQKNVDLDLSKSITKSTKSLSNAKQQTTNDLESVSEKPKTEEKIGQPKFKPSVKPKQIIWNEKRNEYLKTSSYLFCEMSFSEFGLNERLLKHLEDVLHFTKPTLIQKAAIPSILQYRDVY
jgi:hypothetical protein